MTLERLNTWRDAALEWLEQAWLWLMLPIVALCIAALAAALACGLALLIVWCLG